jgi:hypothetical protein
MEAQPLSKIIHAKAKKLGVEKIILQFTGGSDEGYLNVELVGEESHEYRYDEKAKDFYQEIEDWAWEVYSYSGAGDGGDYGDNITYDLVKGEVSTDEWYDAPQYTTYEPTKLKLADEE